MSEYKVVVCSEFSPPNWKWISAHLPNISWQFFATNNSKGSLSTIYSRVVTALQTVLAAKKADLIVSHGPYMALYCAFFKWLLRTKTPHVSYSFNFAVLPEGFALWRMKLLFKLIDSLVVSSTMEKELYAKHFEIPEEIIDCVLWGVAEPKFTIKPAISEQPYISAVGGNARDYKTFMNAMAALPELQAIAVMRPENVQGLVIPPNVNVLTNIPFDDALSIIKHSMFTVLPLVSTETPCGHVTLVVAMYLGVPCVITESTGIEDYIDHGKTGLMCQQGSSESLVESISLLSSDENLRQQIAKNGEQFVRKSCTESNYVSHLLSILERK